MKFDIKLSEPTKRKFRRARRNSNKLTSLMLKVARPMAREFQSEVRGKMGAFVKKHRGFLQSHVKGKAFQTRTGGIYAGVRPHKPAGGYGAFLEHGGEVFPTNSQWMPIPAEGGPALRASGAKRYLKGPRSAGKKLRFVKLKSGDAMLVEDRKSAARRPGNRKRRGRKPKLKVWYWLVKRASVKPHHWLKQSGQQTMSSAPQRVGAAVREYLRETLGAGS